MHTPAHTNNMILDKLIRASDFFFKLKDIVGPSWWAQSFLWGRILWGLGIAITSSSVIANSLYKLPKKNIVVTWIAQSSLILSALKSLAGLVSAWVVFGWETTKEYQGCYAKASNGKPHPMASCLWMPLTLKTLWGLCKLVVIWQQKKVAT